MSELTSADGLSFRDLVFSDLRRYRPDQRPSWLKVAARGLSNPGVLASVVLRAQQCCMRSGHVKAAFLLRTLGMLMFSADFVPGMTVGPGLLMPHPNGITIGNGLVVGANVTFGSGITAGVKQPDVADSGFPTICDGAVVLANAVLVGPVTVGAYAQVGANTVVLSDVPDYAVVFGVPARKVGTRKGILPGSLELLSEPPSPPPPPSPTPPPD